MPPRAATIKIELLDSFHGFHFLVPEPWPEYNDARWIYRKNITLSKKLICTYLILYESLQNVLL